MLYGWLDQIEFNLLKKAIIGKSYAQIFASGNISYLGPTHFAHLHSLESHAQLQKVKKNKRAKI